ncbi:hypothetical protein HK104_005989 [Borealophlyctis nickersoniae]|nr:hypothetical protein HK104_005989 [Borealophlyctis nickersoniae]
MPERKSGKPEKPKQKAKDQGEDDQDQLVPTGMLQAQSSSSQKVGPPQGTKSDGAKANLPESSAKAAVRTERRRSFDSPKRLPSTLINQGPLSRAFSAEHVPARPAAGSEHSLHSSSSIRSLSNTDSSYSGSRMFLSNADISINPSTISTSNILLSRMSHGSLSSAASSSASLVDVQEPKPLNAYEAGEVLSWNGVQHTDGNPVSPDQPTLGNEQPPDNETPGAQGEDRPDLTRRHPSVQSIDTLGGFWDYFKSELTSTDFDEGHDVKKERVQNFLSVPYELERLMTFGYLICFDSFLYIFTILPIRIGIALGKLLKSFVFRTTPLKSAQKCDLIKGALICLCWYMLQSFDASRLYHAVRGQAIIKLYVIFNVLEICDKLCSAFGHDILDSLFSATAVRSAHSSPTSTHRRRLGRFTHFVVALLYVFTHSIVLFYQVMTLNVAVNSYNNALLTLLLSNQFVEIKGSVFKKFERENLFQLSCADIVERFQLSVFLGIITLRNFIELTGGSSFDEAITYLRSYAFPYSVPAAFAETILSFDISIPSTWAALVAVPFSLLKTFQSFLATPEYKLLETLVTPVIVVYGTEVLVDWLKHAFITKFNQIKPTVYGRFRDSLCRDLAGAKGRKGEDIGEGGSRRGSLLLEEEQSHMAFVDQSPIVARRIGFVSIPLSCLVVRVATQTLQMLGYIGPPVHDEVGGNQFGHDTKPPHDALASIIRLSSWIAASDWETLRDGFLKWMANQDINLIMEKAATVATWIAAVGGIFLCLLFFKVVVGMSLLKVARRRTLQLQDEHHLHHHQHAKTVAFPPDQPSTTVKEPLPQKAQSMEVVAEKGKSEVGEKVSNQTKSDGKTGEDRLDRVDRFTMVRSRIV